MPFVDEEWSCEVRVQLSGVACGTFASVQQNLVANQKLYDFLDPFVVLLAVPVLSLPNVLPNVIVCASNEGFEGGSTAGEKLGGVSGACMSLQLVRGKAPFVR